MARVLRWFYICLYASIAAAILVIALGYEDKLFADDEVIETYEAGPIKVPKKKVSGVKTNFTWSKPGNCNCDEGQGPCIQSFLDKRVEQPQNRYPSMIEDYYIQNNMGSLYQGAGQVPWGIEVSSVRLLNIPFCRQTQDKNSSTK